jgi:hypothetical protein
MGIKSSAVPIEIVIFIQKLNIRHANIFFSFDYKTHFTVEHDPTSSENGNKIFIV